MKKIKYEKLKSLVEEVFEKKGLKKDDAKLISDVLVESDVCGIDSHGINRINRYLKAIEKEDIKIYNEPFVESEFFAIAKIDANHTIGQKAGFFGMNKAIELAQNFGIGAVSIKNSNHFGIAGYYSKLATEKDMIGISFTNTAPLVVPTNGKEAILGTNPIAIGVPSGLDYPWLMDFATSIIPRGKLEVANKLGKKIKKGYAVDCNGNFCINPGEILKTLESDRLGGLINIGEHKGYGLSAAVDILCGVLSGSAFGKDVYSNGEPQVGHFFIVIDIKRFMGIEEFKKRLQDFIKMLKDSSKENSVVLIHGEKEYLEKKKRLKYGIPLEDEYIKLLNDLKEKYNLKTII